MATEYLTNDTDLGVVADAIRAKTGKMDAIAYPDGFVTEIGTLADTSDATATAVDILAGQTAYVASGKVTGTMQKPNYRKWTGEITSIITGSGAYVSLAVDEVIGQVSNLDSLLVRLTTDFSGDDAYTLLGCIAVNSPHIIDTSALQFAHRIGATAGVYSDVRSSNSINISSGFTVGQLRISGDSLMWVVDSNNYAVRPCNYVAEMMW